LAKFKQPKKIIFIENLPRNAMGKVQKAELRKKYKSLFEG
jgi:malonyl-CoA/methylmalonyl-CoA synthetase